MCSCNHPRWEKSMEDESRAKFYKSRSRNHMKQKRPKSEIDGMIINCQFISNDNESLTIMIIVIF